MKYSRSIASTLFAFLVLFSSTHVMIGIHVCCGKIQHIRLFNKAEGCAYGKQMPQCHRIQSSSCCQDETLIHNAQNFNSINAVIDLSSILYFSDVIQSPVLLSEIIPNSSDRNIQFHNYDPPLRSSDLVVAFHVFLI